MSKTRDEVRKEHDQVIEDLRAKFQKEMTDPVDPPYFRLKGIRLNLEEMVKELERLKAEDTEGGQSAISHLKDLMEKSDDARGIVNEAGILYSDIESIKKSQSELKPDWKTNKVSQARIALESGPYSRQGKMTSQKRSLDEFEKDVESHFELLHTATKEKQQVDELVKVLEDKYGISPEDLYPLAIKENNNVSEPSYESQSEAGTAVTAYDGFQGTEPFALNAVSSQGGSENLIGNVSLRDSSAQSSGFLSVPTKSDGHGRRKRARSLLVGESATTPPGTSASYRSRSLPENSAESEHIPNTLGVSETPCEAGIPTTISSHVGTDVPEIKLHAPT